MNKKYILSVDQSTQGTKVFLFDEQGKLVLRKDKPHEQIINQKGWVSHDGEEIYQNTIELFRQLLQETGIQAKEIAALGISNQRETSIAWNRDDGKPVAPAIVWQCNRAEDICKGLEGSSEMVRSKTGIPLSPYFPAAKFSWLIQNEPQVKMLLAEEKLCLGTMDSYLVFRLTGGAFKTDYSNASRTQLFNLQEQCFDKEICKLFQIPMECLPEIMDSDACFGYTDLEGLLETPIPIHAVMGDSHGALFGQGCLEPGMLKATYGTGSSIMMNVGNKPACSENGLVCSVGFKAGGKMSYVLEGNLNYTGALITWLKKDLQLIAKDSDTEDLARQANSEDMTCIIPAFTGLGAPYWDSEAKAAILGMSRTTGRAEIAKAALASIAQQITDIVEAMEKDAGLNIRELRVDGGPTRNAFLMQLQSDLCESKVLIPQAEELSGIGVAYAAGLAAGVYSTDIFERLERKAFTCKMSRAERTKYRTAWKDAVGRVLVAEHENI